MDKNGNDKPMLGGIQSEDDIWTDCLKVILSMLGNYDLWVAVCSNLDLRLTDRRSMAR